MKSNKCVFLIEIVVLIGLSACSQIKGYFPDKTRDYQLTTEIPPLIVPPDLKDHAIQEYSTVSGHQPILKSAENTPVENVISTEIDEDKEDIYVDLVEYFGGATRIRIEESLVRCWRIVGKALSRQSIEITDRNELENVYFVQYDPDYKQVKDGSLWDEVLFIFGSDPAKEKEFRIQLAENGSLTEIIVLDSDDRPLSKGAGLKLLELLYKTIKKDLAN